ncbi:MAG TPA: 50S ribosomal protein L5 [Candidatus Dormibacteraeota bacterium]|nr:50S ribosomal protein L5 [Candidatus Dormibacteraeota bacterium]
MSAAKRSGAAANGAPLPNLARVYREKAVPALMKAFDYDNVMQVPRIAKVVVNVGIGEAKDNARALESAVGDVRTITGQQPVVIKARKSVAAFKLRAGMPVGIRATLRGRRMWYFLEKLVVVALPRIRDFRGVNSDAFDGSGNYSLGLREQIIFPEVDYDKIDKLRGLEVSIVTTAKTDGEGRSLLAQLGMPFSRQDARVAAFAVPAKRRSRRPVSRTHKR